MCRPFFGAFISLAFHFAVLGTLWKCLEKNMFFFDGNRPFDSVKKTCPQMTIIVTFLDLIRSGVAQFTIGVVECLRTIKAVWLRAIVWVGYVHFGVYGEYYVPGYNTELRQLRTRRAPTERPLMCFYTMNSFAHRMRQQSIWCVFIGWKALGTSDVPTVFWYVFIGKKELGTSDVPSSF